MTYVTYFTAAPAEGKECSFLHLEMLATDLLQEGWGRLPATIFVGGVAYGPRYTSRDSAKEEEEDSFWQGFTAFYERVAPNFIVPNSPEAMTGGVMRQISSGMRELTNTPTWKRCIVCPWKTRMSACASLISIRVCSRAGREEPRSTGWLDQR